MKTFVRPNAGRVMPLLMGFTPSTKIEETDNVKMCYNDELQIMEYEARLIGTKCLRNVISNKRSGVTDNKNVMDDQKNVK